MLERLLGAATLASRGAARVTAAAPTRAAAALGGSQITLAATLGRVFAAVRRVVFAAVGRVSASTLLRAQVSVPELSLAAA